MAEWAFVLTPLLVLPIVLLYRFVGCGEFIGGPVRNPPPRYRDYILPDPGNSNPGDVLHPEEKFVPKKEDVIAYWRLLDKPGALKAVDEALFQDGEYHYTDGALPVEAPTPMPGPPGSEGAPGDFVFPEYGLIASESVWGRTFNGGHVRVPYKDKLYTKEFTLEAWIYPEWGVNSNKNYEHTLFDVGGHFRRYGDPAGSEAYYYGFSVYANRDGRWQVRLRDIGDVFVKPFVKDPPPLVGHGTTHLVVTVQDDGWQSRMTLFVNGKQGATRNQLTYNPPYGAPLFIGLFNRASNPGNPPDRQYPVISTVQEVVLYRKALSFQEIENRYDINRYPTL